MLYNVKKVIIVKILTENSAESMTNQVLFSISMMYLSRTQKGNITMMVGKYLHVHAEELMVSMFSKVVEGISKWPSPLSDKQKAIAW